MTLNDVNVVLFIATVTGAGPGIGPQQGASWRQLDGRPSFRVANSPDTPAAFSSDPYARCRTLAHDGKAAKKRRRLLAVQGRDVATLGLCSFEMLATFDVSGGASDRQEARSNQTGIAFRNRDNFH